MCAGVTLLIFVTAGFFSLEGSAVPLPQTWTRATNIFALHHDDFDLSVPIVASIPSQLPGANMVAMQWMWKQDNATSNAVEADAKTTPSVSSLIRIARAAHRVNLSVYWKPIVVARDGTEMAQLSPSNVTAWFASYSNQILAIAALAQDLGVERLAIGIELQIIATNAANLELWTELISQVRSLYNGHLTYGSNPLVGETSQIPFWSLLDVIGVDLYIPMINPLKPNASMTPTLEDMTGTYTFFLNLKLMQWYWNSTERSDGLQMFVSESGYPSSNGGVERPWVLPPSKNEPGGGCFGNYTQNNTAQSSAFAVQFSVLTSPAYVDAFNGFTQFWYGNPGTSDYIDRQPTTLWPCGWTPVGKPETLLVLQDAFQVL